VYLDKVSEYSQRSEEIHKILVSHKIFRLPLLNHHKYSACILLSATIQEKRGARTIPAAVPASVAQVSRLILNV